MSKDITKNNKTIEVIVVRSPFDRSKHDKTIIPYDNETVYEIVKNNILTSEVAVSINGGIIDEDKWGTTYLSNNDQVVLIPILEGGGDILQIVSLVALFVFAPHIAIGIGGAGAGATVAGVTTLTTFGQFLTVGILLGGGMLISSLGPKPSMPQLGIGGDGAGEQSQFFSFTPTTKQRQGISIPRIFGRLKVYGNVISVNTELNEDNDKQILNLLLALSKGPIKGIVGFADPSIFGTIKLNRQPIENFQDVMVQHRLGTLDQEIITFFDDTINETIRDTLISFGSPVVFTTTGGNFDELEIKIGAPAGIYHQNDQNGFDNHSIGIKIEISIASADNYSTLFEGNITDNRNNLVKRTYRTIDSSIDIIDGNNYDVRVTKTTEDETGIRFADRIQLSSVGEVITDDFIYPTIALAGIKALASDQLSGSLDFSAIVDGNICRVWNGSTFVNEFSDNPAWVLYTILSAPVFSGESPGNYIVERYDGIDPTELDSDSFVELADYCDELVPVSRDDPSTLEKRFVFNGGFDTEQSLLDSANIVLKMCRSAIRYNGIKINIITDKPTDVTQMFGMGNIKVGSFKEHFPPMADRASEIEINFLDAEQDYVKTQFTIFNTGIPNNSNKVSIDLIGCTSSSQAWRQGDYILRNNLFLLKTIEFQTDIDSLAVQVGDVLEFSHDVPRWNQSGRLIDIGVDSVVLSEDFIDEDPSLGEFYQIMIRKEDDTIITKNILSFSENIVTLTEPFTEDERPDVDDIYQIGPSSTISNKFRVIEITVNVDQYALIKCMQYDERIFNGEDLGAELPVIGAEIDPDDELVTDLRVSEEVIITESGVIQRNLNINYDLPVTGSFYQVQIFSRVAGTAWELTGTTTNNLFVIFGTLESTDYEIKVVTLLNDLRTSSFDNSPTGFITTGNNDDFEDQILTVIVDGLQVGGGSTTQFTGKDLALIWDEFPIDDPAPDPNPSVDFWDGIPNNFILDYEVSIFDFGGNLRRTEFVLEPRYTYTYENNFEDGSGTPSRDMRIEVKVRDKFGRVSENPAILVRVQNPIPVILTGVSDVEIGVSANISWTPNGEIDVLNGGGYKLWASQTSPVDTSDDDDLFYRGPNTSFSFAPDTTGEWFYKVAAYDSFDETITTPSQFSLNIVSGELTADYPIPSDIDFASNDPAAGFVSWQAGTILYKGTTYNITASNFSNTYIYWDVDSPTVFSGTNVLNTVIAADAWVMCTNDSGVANPTVGFKSLFGGIIQADTITANQIVVSGINALELLNAPAAAGADVTGDNETFSQESDINVLLTTNAPAQAGADVTSTNETFSQNSDINALLTTNGPAAANADVTSANTAANASAYTGSTIATTFTAAKATDPNADQTSANETYSTANELTTSINASATTLISPGKIIISGGTNLDDWQKSGDLTKIDGGAISADTITVNQMAANSITAANGAIANLTVDTLQIAGSAVETAKIATNAATVPSSAYTSGEILTVGAPSWTTAQSLAITTTGEDLSISFSCRLRTAGASSDSYDIELRRDTTVLAFYDDLFVEGSSANSFSATIGDSPGAGSYTYNIRIQESNGNVAMRSIVITEFKR